MAAGQIWSLAGRSRRGGPRSGRTVHSAKFGFHRAADTPAPSSVRCSGSRSTSCSTTACARCSSSPWSRLWPASCSSPSSGNAAQRRRRPSRRRDRSHRCPPATGNWSACSRCSGWSTSPTRQSSCAVRRSVSASSRSSSPTRSTTSATPRSATPPASSPTAFRDAPSTQWGSDCSLSPTLGSAPPTRAAGCGCCCRCTGATPPSPTGWKRPGSPTTCPLTGSAAASATSKASPGTAR